MITPASLQQSNAAPATEVPAQPAIEQRPVTTHRFTVPTWSVAALERAVKSLCRAARRARVGPEPTLFVDWKSKREVRQEREEVTIIEGSVEGVHHKFSVVPVVECSLTVPGERFGVDGQWRILATLERVQQPEQGDQAGLVLQAEREPTNEIFARPETLPRVEAFRHTPLVCEHCKAKRTRTRTLVLEEVGSGQLRQVGKECAVLFLGDRAEQAVREMEFQEFVSEVLKPYEETEGREYVGGGGVLSAWDAEEVVTHACACVRQRGWEPSTIKVGPSYNERYEPNPDATAVHVSDTLINGQTRETRMAALQAEKGRLAELVSLLDGNEDEASRRMASIMGDKLAKVTQQITEQPAAPYSVTERDRFDARVILDWLGEQNPDPEKDQYMANLKAAYAPGWISEKRLAFAVSLVRAFSRSAEIAAERRMTENSQHFGDVGEKIEMEMKLLRATPYAGEFPGTAYRLCDQHGNLFSWMTSSFGFPSESVGHTFKVKATIKKHAEFRGAKTTELTRLKILGRVEQAIKNPVEEHLVRASQSDPSCDPEREGVMRDGNGQVVAEKGPAGWQPAARSRSR